MTHGNNLEIAWRPHSNLPASGGGTEKLERNPTMTRSDRTRNNVYTPKEEKFSLDITNDFFPVRVGSPSTGYPEKLRLSHP